MTMIAAVWLVVCVVGWVTVLSPSDADHSRAEPSPGVPDVGPAAGGEEESGGHEVRTSVTPVQQRAPPRGRPQSRRHQVRDEEPEHGGEGHCLTCGGTEG